MDPPQNLSQPIHVDLTAISRPPLSEPPMAVDVSDTEGNLDGATTFKQYYASLNKTCSIFTCGAIDLCTVTDVNSNSTIRVEFGCSELPVYNGNTPIGLISMEYCNDGSWVRVPTLKDPYGRVLARCYLARPRNQCCTNEMFFILDVVGYQTFSAPRNDCGRVRFNDQSGNTAIEINTCDCSPMIHARSDIPHYAIALIPFMNSNQGR